MSASMISRLTGQFKEQYGVFDRQDLSGHTFVYIWADGIYLKAGLGTEKACLMVLIGADTVGKKHLIALREGYRESTESWSDVPKAIYTGVDTTSVELQSVGWWLENRTDCKTFFLGRGRRHGCPITLT